MVRIDKVEEGSVAAKRGILPGDYLLEINSRAVNDVIDYRFFVTEENLSLVLMRDGKKYKTNIRKPQYSDIGLEFETYLMDEKRHCRNKCVFCFIDQNPKGMRETIYFKDDDERLSFLFGNYITLTNLKESDIERIIEMKISPINVSVHTTNPELRIRMMKNKNAGDAFGILKRFCDSGISINAQIVLCRGYNDKAELTRTMDDLKSLFPKVQSVAIVPAGITKHRDGLAILEPYDKESSAEALKQIVEYGNNCVKTTGHRIFFPADEFYVMSETPIPDESFYEGYMQLENGVGMLRSLREEFLAALNTEDKTLTEKRIVTVVTGHAASKEIKELCKLAEDFFDKDDTSPLKVNVIAIDNRFFGENITIAGLVVGKDIIEQLKGENLGDEVLIPRSMLRSEGDLFLDDVHIDELSEKLGTIVTTVENDGWEFWNALAGF